MRLPNGDRAFIDVDKLRHYCLSMAHPRGKHKARVFAAALGLTDAQVEVLGAALRMAARSELAVQGPVDEYGSRYLVDFEMAAKRGRRTVRSIWLIRNGEDYPRLITCYVV